MIVQLATRTLRTTDLRLLWKFAWNFGVRSALGMMKFKARLRRGEYFPAFLHISTTNACNLRCQGCWVDVDAPREFLDLDLLNRVINNCKKHGDYFFGILGGEPFLHPQLMELLVARAATATHSIRRLPCPTARHRVAAGPLPSAGRLPRRSGHPDSRSPLHRHRLARARQPGRFAGRRPGALP